MHRTLVAAGHRVTLAAPVEGQSGSSVRITSGIVTCEQKGDGVWAVGGSPADAVLVGFHHILAERPPDLVISGSNFGQNVGTLANSSGTVGAAIMAMQLGVPAIAVSVGIRYEERDAQPHPFPSTVAAFGRAAAFTVELITQLQRTRRAGSTLLPNRTILNVNYPALPVNQIQGVQFTQLGRSAPYSVIYRNTDTPSELKPELVPRVVDEPVENADTTFFQQGYITISVLDGDWTADAPIRTSLSSCLADLKVSSGQ
jgi:5'/3'-nucleotidase SurE